MSNVSNVVSSVVGSIGSAAGGGSPMQHLTSSPVEAGAFAQISPGSSSDMSALAARFSSTLTDVGKRYNAALSVSPSNLLQKSPEAASTDGLSPGGMSINDLMNSTLRATEQGIAMSKATMEVSMLTSVASSAKGGFESLYKQAG